MAKAILEKATQAARARAAAKKARELVRRKSALESNRMPGKLADCHEKDPPRPNCSSWRVILQAARPKWAETPTFRPSCLCGARC